MVRLCENFLCIFRRLIIYKLDESNTIMII